MMNEEIEDPYHKNDGNGSIVLNGNQDIYFNGCAKGALTYTAVFVGRNQNCLGSSEQVHEIEVTILQTQE